MDDTAPAVVEQVASQIHATVCTIYCFHYPLSEINFETILPPIVGSQIVIYIFLCISCFIIYAMHPAYLSQLKFYMHF